MPQALAVELLKTYGASIPQRLPESINLGSVLKRFVVDKAFDVESVIALAQGRRFGKWLHNYVLRSESRTADADDILVFNYFAKQLRSHGSLAGEYSGSGSENARIDAALSAHSPSRSMDGKFGTGAASRFRLDVEYGIGGNLRDVPIAIVGFGMAGILTAYALLRAGFRVLTIYEKSKHLGIWNHPNVYQRSRNNPLVIDYLANSLAAAPGSGTEVRQYLANLASSVTNNVVVQDKAVTEIKPGNLQHTLILADKTEKTFPIVINCIGLGRPAPISDPARITTNMTATEAGHRWQQILNPEDARGKHFLFIGLGNSTGEMLRQLHTLQDAGVDTDYQVLTHYPEDAVQNPDDTVIKGKQRYRVFRDISVPNLVDFQGDLPDNRYDYFRALRSSRIITDVKSVTKQGNAYTVKHSDEVEAIGADNLYTLIGYKHPKEDLVKFGCHYDDKNKCILYDYDGEMIQVDADSLSFTDANDRMFKGYYGMGAVLDAPHNRNAIVIPGVVHRMGDLMFGIIMRAAEHLKRSGQVLNLG